MPQAAACWGEVHRLLPTCPFPSSPLAKEGGVQQERKCGGQKNITLLSCKRHSLCPVLLLRFLFRSKQRKAQRHIPTSGGAFSASSRMPGKRAQDGKRLRAPYLPSLQGAGETAHLPCACLLKIQAPSQDLELGILPHPVLCTSTPKQELLLDRRNVNRKAPAP